MQKNVELLFKKYADDPVFFAQHCLGVLTWSKMEEILYSVADNERTCVKASHSVGKCKEENEIVQLADGSIVKVKDLINKKFQIESYNTEKNERVFVDGFAFDNGEKLIKHITFLNKTELKITDNHPLYVAKKTGRRNYRSRNIFDYVEVVGFTNEINVGDLIAVPIKTNISESSFSMDDNEIKLLAYIIGDGCTRNNNISITKSDEEVVREIYEIAKYYGGEIRKVGISYFFRKSQAIREIVKNNYLKNKLSYDKIIPENIFKLNENQICLFLSRLYACDGYVNDREITYCSVSRELIDGIYLLLKRIGIKRPIIRKKKTSWTYNGVKKYSSAYEISIRNVLSMKVFCEKIKIIGKKLSKQKQILNNIITSDKIKLCRRWDTETCIDGFYWEEVKDIKKYKAKTVGITIPENSVYITPFAFEHNTFVAAIAALWFFNTYPDSKVITTAPVAMQVRQLLWAEIGSLFNRSRIKLNGELVDLKIKTLDSNHFMLGFSTDKAARAEGFHAPSVMFIFDEAKGIPQWMWESAKGAMTGGICRWLVVSTTDGVRIGENFYNAFNKDTANLWNKISVDCIDTPFFTGEKFKGIDFQTLKPFEVNPDDVQGKIQLATPKWEMECKEEWGEESVLYLTKCRAHLVDSSINGIMSLSDVASMFTNFDPKEEIPDGMDEVGVDIARFGDDQTVFVKRRNFNVLDIMEFSKLSVPQVISELEEFVSYNKEVLIKIDDSGVGGGVTDGMRLKGYNVVAINFGSRAQEPDKYGNTITEMWVKVGKIISDVKCKYNERLQVELVSRLKTILPNGKLMVESKKDYKKRMKKSPDYADAFLLAFYEVETTDPEEENFFIPHWYS
jgi:hypothetical protein